LSRRIEAQWTAEGLDALVWRVENMLRLAERVSTLFGRRSAKGLARVSAGRV
jgi:hypothetical protein